MYCVSLEQAPVGAIAYPADLPHEFMMNEEIYAHTVTLICDQP